MLARLVHEWRQRLTRLRRAASDPDQPAPWLCAIRVRILTFLIGRYAARVPHEGPAPPPPSRPGPRPIWPPPFDAIIRADGPPPRESAVIRGLLRDIHRLNQARPRWRFWP
jgi:hypothetical protein